MPLSKKYFFTAADEAGLLTYYLGLPVETVSRWWHERRQERFKTEQAFGKLPPDSDYRLQVKIRLMDVVLRAHEAIHSGLGRIHSNRLNFPPTDCLWQVYDLFASELITCGQPLTDPLLEKYLPALVFQVAVEREWIAYPLRHSTSNYGVVPPTWDEQLGPIVPGKELIERFGGYRVTRGYGAWFGHHLKDRIEHWRAERPPVAPGPDPLSVSVAEYFNRGTENQICEEKGSEVLANGAGKERPQLNTALIKGWMDEQDENNETMAARLHVSERVISSMRNNGRYHGSEAVIKLANEMGRNPEELYLP